MSDAIGTQAATRAGEQQGNAALGNYVVADDSEIGQDIYVQVALSDEDRKRLSDWLQKEIENSKNERSTMTENFAEWERLYEARPKVARKTIPWDNASNLVVPVIATAVDAVLARLINAIFGADELWNLRQRSAQWSDLVEPMEVWLNWVQENVMKMYQVCQRWFLSCIKFGTGILKVPWERTYKNIIYADRQGGVSNDIVVTHDGPLPKSVSLTNFFVSSDILGSMDIQQCEWVAERALMTYKMLKEKEASGIFFEVDKILGQERTQPLDEVETEVNENVGIEVSEYKDWEIWEVYCSYILEAPEPEQGGDTSTGVIPSELIVTIEPQSGHILRAVYNFYRHQERPFHVIRWMPRENSFFGIGLCQMLADIQEEITTIHNQRLDNATLANTKIFKHTKGTNLGPLDVYPGAFLEVSEMDDLEAFDLGQEHSSLLQEELHSNAIGEKRSGVSDYTVGRESAAIGSNATATSTMALIREGNKRFRMSIKDVREALNSVAHQVIMLYQQFAPGGEVMYEIFDEDERGLVSQYFRLPFEYTKTHVYIDTPALSESNNDEIERQTYMVLLETIEKFYMGVGNAALMMSNPMMAQYPAVQQVAAQGIQAASGILERLLESFDIRDTKRYVPNISDLLSATAMSQQMGAIYGLGTGQAPNGGAGAPAQGNPAQGQQPPMGSPQGAPQGGQGQGAQGGNGGPQRSSPGSLFTSGRNP